MGLYPEDIAKVPADLSLNSVIKRFITGISRLDKKCCYL